MNSKSCNSVSRREGGGDVTVCSCRSDDDGKGDALGGSGGGEWVGTGHGG